LAQGVEATLDTFPCLRHCLVSRAR
jgi:hypothetical protein